MQRQMRAHRDQGGRQRLQPRDQRAVHRDAGQKANQPRFDHRSRQPRLRRFGHDHRQRRQRQRRAVVQRGRVDRLHGGRIHSNGGRCRLAVHARRDQSPATTTTTPRTSAPFTVTQPAPFATPVLIRAVATGGTGRLHHRAHRRRRRHRQHAAGLHSGGLFELAARRRRHCPSEARSPSRPTRTAFSARRSHPASRLGNFVAIQVTVARPDRQVRLPRELPRQRNVAESVSAVRRHHADRQRLYRYPGQGPLVQVRRAARPAPHGVAVEPAGRLRSRRLQGHRRDIPPAPRVSIMRAGRVSSPAIVSHNRL